MKTAEEWYKHLTLTEVVRKSDGIDMLVTEITRDQVKQIQLDAWKQGMTDATKLVAHPKDREMILSTRDIKTSL